MNEKITDERVVQELRKIHSSALSILMALLALSAFIQNFFFKKDFAYIAGESICFFICLAYITFKKISIGINSNNCSDKKNLIGGLIGGFIGIVVYYFFAGLRDLSVYVIFFIVYIVFYFITQKVLSHLSIKKQKQIENELDKEEDEI